MYVCMYLSTVGLSCDFDLYLQYVGSSTLTSGTEPRHPAKGSAESQSLDHQGSLGFSFLILHPGESVSCTKHTDAIPDPRAVNQDKKNMLFSL